MKRFDDKSGNGNGIALVNQYEVRGQLSSVGVTDNAAVYGSGNIQLSGPFVASLTLERSLDNGVTWQPVTTFGIPTIFTGPCSESFSEPEPGVLYRFNCTNYTSGIIRYRISK